MGSLRLGWRALGFPTGFDHDQAMVFTRLLAMRPLHGLWRQPDPLVVDVIGTPRGLRWQLGMTPREAGLLLPQLRGQLPAVTVSDVTERKLPALNAALELRLTDTNRPLRTDAPDAVTAALLTAVAGVHGNEALVLSWVIGPWLDRPAVARGDRVGPLGLGAELDTEEAAALRAKLAEPLYGAVGRIGVAAATPARRTQLAQRVLGALEIARAPGVAFAVRHVSPRRALERLSAHQGPLFNWPVPLNAAELAAVAGWPTGTPTLPGVTYQGHRQLPASSANWVPEHAAEAAPPGRYRILGRATFPSGQAGLVHLPALDARHHLHVIGPIGSGKSVLLSRLIHADIEAGRGVVVIEPKADLIADVLDRIPEHRRDDVVLLDPADDAAAVGIDVLAGGPELAAERISDVIRELWPGSWGPRTAQLLHAAVVTLARSGQSLADLDHLFTNPTYRAELLRQAPDPLGVGPYWQWFGSLSDNQRNAIVGPSINRLSQFTMRRALRGIIGQTEPRFALADVFTKRRILLVDLATGVVGPESARLLGSLVLSGLWHAAQARVRVPPERRHTVAFYIDEFHTYTSGIAVDLGDLLAMARGLGVALHLAHQGLYQLTPSLRAGILTNARSRVVFQTTAADTDARTLAATLGAGITADDLAALGAWEAYARLVSGHAVNPAASLATLPPSPPQGTAPEVRETSRSQWARPLDEIDAAILARRQAAHPATTVGRRRRATTP